MKLFKDMTLSEKLKHLELCRLNAIECIRNGESSELADIADWPDYWGDWLIRALGLAIEELEQQAELKLFGANAKKILNKLEKMI